MFWRLEEALSSLLCRSGGRAWLTNGSLVSDRGSDLGNHGLRGMNHHLTTRALTPKPQRKVLQQRREGRSYFLSPGASGGTFMSWQLIVSVASLNGESRRIVLLLLSCVQARRDTRFKEKMAELPRRPESSEGVSGRKRYKRHNLSGANQRPFCSEDSQSEVLLRVFASKVASANLECLCRFRIWIKL